MAEPRSCSGAPNRRAPNRHLFAFRQHDCGCAFAPAFAQREFRWENPMKFPHRRKFLHLAAGAAALPMLSRGARAQAYPSRPVRLIVGFAAGGPSDLYARLIGQWLSERLKQQFVVENRAGAGGNLATETVVKAPPD